MIPPYPEDEQDRLAELRSYDILDTLPQIEYDELTFLASAICETPIALVSLVDADRQWFKSKVGLDVPQTPRDLAFCAHAIIEPEEVLVVNDTTEDPRFRENELVTGDPHIRFYAGAPLSTPRGHALGTICVIDREPRQLTERQKKALSALASQVMGQLELRKTTSRLIDVNFALHEANSEIRRMYHTLAHELKTPLTSVREFVSIVVDGIAGPIAEEQDEYLRAAISGCDHMAGHVDDLVDVSRIETGKLSLDPEWCDLNVLLSRVVGAVSQSAAQKGVTLRIEVEGETRCWIDERRITQVVSNLITNAVKFTDAGGTVIASACPSLKDPDSFEVAVRDTGRGIPEEEQAQIFDRLYQVSEDCWADKGGLGLGLYLCKEVVDLHGGTIWVESTFGEGSEFRFRIPVGPTAASDDQETPAALQVEG